MARFLPLTYGTALLGLAGASTYVLCSADVLNELTLFLIH